jgi:thiol-disulfide isomerase/thioredoxin
MKTTFFRVLLLTFFLQISPHAKAINRKDTVNKNETVVKIKMANASGYSMFFVNQLGAVDSVYREEKGYRVYRLSPSNSLVTSFIIKYPTAKKNLNGIPQMNFFLKKGAVITIEGDANRPAMSKIESQDRDVMDYEVFRAREAAIQTDHWEKMKTRPQHLVADSTSKKELIQLLVALRDKRVAWEKEFVKNYSQSYAGLQVFYLFYKNMDKEKAWSIFNAFPEIYKNDGAGKEMASFFDAVHHTSVGRQVDSFREKGIDGDVIDLNALNGKFVIIDFWGSWCVPCRQSHPHLKSLYNKYHDKGLEIIGIVQEYGTLEAREKSSKKAIKEDGLPWPQILNDPQGTNLVEKYAITAFPTKLLVDRNGVIILRTNDHEELDRKLEELFK